VDVSQTTLKIEFLTATLTRLEPAHTVIGFESV
jgi:hypothetical protein